MRCHQCDRPAMFTISDQNIPLCVHCYHVLSEALNRDALINMAHMNRALDDMTATVGFMPAGERYPVQALARAMARPMTYNNIRVENSQIGVLNTGNVAKIDAAITLTKGSDAEAIGDLILRFTQQLIQSRELEEKDRSEVVELVQSLSEQVVGQRKRSTIWAIITAIQEKVALVAGLSESAKQIAQAARDLFGG